MKQPPERLEAFRTAVLDFNSAPTPVNTRRYLAASRLLELESARRLPVEQPSLEDRR